MHDFVALGKHQKKSVLENVKVFSCQCGLDLCPNNSIEHAHLDFDFKTIDPNHDIAWNDKIESHVDHMLSERAWCGDDFSSLDDPKGNRHMHKDFLKTKEFIQKVRSKADKEKSPKDAIKKMQVECKLQESIDFPSFSKKSRKNKGV